jgi:hypothetical protein
MSTMTSRFLRVLLVATIGLLPALATATQPAPPRDGQHDFDFEIGTWNTHVSRLVQPLSERAHRGTQSPPVQPATDTRMSDKEG